MKCSNHPCCDCIEICPDRKGPRPWSGKEERFLLYLINHGETGKQAGDRLGRSGDACQSKYRELTRI